MEKNTTYTQDYAFFTKVLKYNKIAYHVATDFASFPSDIDLELRQKVGLSEIFEHLQKIFEQEIKPDTLFYITDEFYCHYILMILPNTNPSETLIIGPYITDNDNSNISTFLCNTEIAPAWFEILKNYYTEITSLPNIEALNALVYTFADSIWGENNYKIEYFSNGIPESALTLTLTTPPDSQRNLDILSNIEIIENFYSEENALMHAISHGQTARAKSILSNIPLFNFRQQMEPLQNLKVFTIVLNTLFRKAAEQGGVHPIYVDRVSNSFLQRIVDFTRSDNILDLWNEMIQKYCALVNNHSTRNFSLPIQKVVIRINLDLSADLSLKTLADYLNVNASYLSNLFRKETGDTLTNYVNKKRMDYATYLLSTTTLPISTIAQNCGILDDNYFTKLFKKHYQMTPTQFRDSVGQHDLTK